MTNMKLTCCFILATFSLFAKNTPTHFQPSNIQAGIQAAASAQKLLIAHFVADWCMPSQWMEEHAFNHPEVSKLLTTDYHSIKVDIDQATGFQDKEQYEVETLPTVLIFSARGQLLERIEGITDVENIQNQLQKHNLNIHKQVPAHLKAQTQASTSLIDFSHLDRPAFEHAVKNERSTAAASVISTPNLPMTIEEVYGPQATAPTTSLTHIPKPQPDAIYGVEVAVLQQYSAVVKYVRTLERRVSDKVFILLRREQGQKKYHVIVGKVQNRQAAFKLRKRLLTNNIKGMIKVLDTL